mgnify:CR=1 FL=1
MAMKQPGRKVHRSANGKAVDMDMLRQRNELTPAVGNARVNARGDELGPGGQIIKKREDVVAEHYTQAGSVTEASGRTTVETPVAEKTVKPTPVSAKKSASKAKEEVVIDAPLTAAEQEMLDEADDWVEDTDGNFVKNGD